MDITIKVDPTRADPAAEVRRAVASLRPDLVGAIGVEEVFPGVTTGSRAGMVVLHITAAMTPKALDALVDALREQPLISYAATAAPRKQR